MSTIWNRFNILLSQLQLVSKAHLISAMKNLSSINVSAHSVDGCQWNPKENKKIACTWIMKMEFFFHIRNSNCAPLVFCIEVFPFQCVPLLNDQQHHMLYTLDLVGGDCRNFFFTFSLSHVFAIAGIGKCKKNDKFRHISSGILCNLCIKLSENCSLQWHRQQWSNEI